jgi:hypothetical protein
MPPYSNTSAGAANLAETAQPASAAANDIPGPDKITEDGREQLRALGFNV